MFSLRAGVALALCLMLLGTSVAFAQQSAVGPRSGASGDTRKPPPHRDVPTALRPAETKAQPGDRHVFLLLLLGLEKARAVGGGAGR